MDEGTLYDLAIKMASKKKSPNPGLAGKTYPPGPAGDMERKYDEIEKQKNQNTYRPENQLYPGENPVGEMGGYPQGTFQPSYNRNMSDIASMLLQRGLIRL